MKHTSIVEEAAKVPARLPALPWHVALLTSYLPPHQLQSYAAMSRRFQRFSILISTPMERHRPWDVDWGDLEVHLQRTWTWRGRWRHAAGFTDPLDVHFPLDTMSRLRQLRPDVVVSGDLGFRSLCSACYVLQNRRTPLVLWACVSERTEQGRGRLRHALRKWLLKRAAAVIVNGASGRRYISGLGVEADRIFEIPYSSPAGLFDRCPLERDGAQALRLLYVGQLTERKGLLPFLHVLCRWAREHAARQLEWQLVGRGPQQAALQQVALPDNLKLSFLGVQSHEALSRLYAEAGVLVFPTLADEWGLVVNEGLASGLPVLGSAYSGAVEELCREGETGWIFRPDGLEETYRAIDRALHTPPEQLNRMRQACRAAVQVSHPEVCAGRLAAVLQRVMGRGTASSENEIHG